MTGKENIRHGSACIKLRKRPGHTPRVRVKGSGKAEILAGCYIVLLEAARVMGWPMEDVLGIMVQAHEDEELRAEEAELLREVKG